MRSPFLSAVLIGDEAQAGQEMWAECGVETPTCENAQPRPPLTTSPISLKRRGQAAARTPTGPPLKEKQPKNLIKPLLSVCR